MTITENENAKNNENPFNRKLCDKGRARASNNLRDSWENLFSSLTFGFSVNFHLFYALKCWIGSLTLEQDYLFTRLFILSSVLTSFYKINYQKKDAEVWALIKNYSKYSHPSHKDSIPNPGKNFKTMKLNFSRKKRLYTFFFSFGWKKMLNFPFDFLFKFPHSKVWMEKKSSWNKLSHDLSF